MYRSNIALPWIETPVLISHKLSEDDTAVFSTQQLPFKWMLLIYFSSVINVSLNNSLHIFAAMLIIHKGKDLLVQTHCWNNPSDFYHIFITNGATIFLQLYQGVENCNTDMQLEIQLLSSWLNTGRCSIVMQHGITNPWNLFCFSA